ncbi:MAG: PhzF family phenazine biosynthesis protein [Actinomycetota bacterium]|jgi:predicted PhzF superfamily epimerase YddE/YHI9
MRSRRFVQVDVFTAEAYRGNPLAVVCDGEGLSTDEMQRFAHWTNLSETTFLLAPSNPEADYRVRIFTPTVELGFAGHPTLGSCHAWLLGGGKPKQSDVVVQECGAGLIRVRQSAQQLAFAAPPLRRSGRVDDATVAQIARVLNVDIADIVESQWIDNGPGWVAVMLRDADAVLALKPAFVEGLYIGVVGMYPPGSACAYEVRAFFPKDGSTVEDPVTGSLNASLAQWLLRTGRVTAPYTASQGAVLGRAGRVYISSDADGADVWVGGDCVTCIAGTVDL